MESRHRRDNFGSAVLIGINQYESFAAIEWTQGGFDNDVSASMKSSQNRQSDKLASQKDAKASMNLLTAVCFNNSLELPYTSKFWQKLE
jgi:hypothetical protein